MRWRRRRWWDADGDDDDDEMTMTRLGSQQLDDEEMRKMKTIIIVAKIIHYKGLGLPGTSIIWSLLASSWHHSSDRKRNHRKEHDSGIYIKSGSFGSCAGANVCEHNLFWLEKAQQGGSLVCSFVGCRCSSVASIPFVDVCVCKHNCRKTVLSQSSQVWWAR